MENKNQVAETTISDEGELDTLRQGIDDPMVLKEQLNKEAEARRQLTARAKKAEAELKTLREQTIKKDEGQSTVNSNQPQTPMEDERLELRLNGYSKEEVNYIMANGGAKVLEDPNSFTTIAITTRREQLAAEKAAAGTNQSGGEDQFREANFNLPRNPSLNDLKKSIGDMEKVLPRAD